MRVWDEIRQELEKTRQDFAGEIASLRAEVAELRAAQPSTVTPGQPEAEPETVQPQQ